MQIKIRPNIEMPEIPSVVEIAEAGVLRDVLLIVVPQIVDRKTGELKYDPDIWTVKHNGISVYSLKDGLNTRMHEGDVIELELILLAGG
jgi:hypothetical protein